LTTLTPWTKFDGTGVYHMPTWPTAANMPQAAAVVKRWGRPTDGWTLYRYIDPAAYYTSSVKNMGNKVLHYW